MLYLDGETRDKLNWNWSMNDLMVVMAEYGITPIEELANRLGRSVRAVQEFARRHDIPAVENHRRAGGCPGKRYSKRHTLRLARLSSSSVSGSGSQEGRAA